MMRTSNTGPPHLGNERVNRAREMQTGMHWLCFLPFWLFQLILKLQRGYR